MNNYLVAYDAKGKVMAYVQLLGTILKYHEVDRDSPLVRRYWPKAWERNRFTRCAVVKAEKANLEAAKK
jgi:hypothetical protein